MDSYRCDSSDKQDKTLKRVSGQSFLVPGLRQTPNETLESTLVTFGERTGSTSCPPPDPCDPDKHIGFI